MNSTVIDADTCCSNRIESFMTEIESNRLKANSDLDESHRGKLGQFMTPVPVSRLMASLFEDLEGDICLLDAGAGVGSLAAAVVEESCTRLLKPTSINVIVCEVDKVLIDYLELNMELCALLCKEYSIAFNYQLISEDFIEKGVSWLTNVLFKNEKTPHFNKAILNPPYHKINSKSRHKEILKKIGIESTNLYSAFIALVIKTIANKGEVVAITPRSFCNGPYFKHFRKLLLNETSIKNIHTFERRDKAFKGDKVLQENLIYHLKKNGDNDSIIISSTECAEDNNIIQRVASYDEVVNPNDPDLFIHIAISEKDGNIAKRASSLLSSLKELDLQLSTGRVVDFRAKEYLRMDPDSSTVPLVYPCHFKNGFIVWPKEDSKKPNALVDCKETENLMVPSGYYVLVKRFSAKEERRRIVAAIYDPSKVSSEKIGFENHLNYFHLNGEGLDFNVAVGLLLFLNSTLIDDYFRQFSGHTQVNATDLRRLRYPSLDQLIEMGGRFSGTLPPQEDIDLIIEEFLFS